MSEVKPLSSLRNYTKIFNELKPGHPIIFTKNGNEVGTLIDSKEWNKLQSEMRLIKELTREDNSFDGISLKEFRKNQNHNA
ncbi:type II toxin-antitoxin system prevent-host-death family antitoxin [Companilactobacillus farciminis]|uniref:type II toxin-antitoxin system prevent-host-death family antitoxin n=1 Tax=Companilactobacillus farciminis TaxID=1612 RepID=UPI00241E3FFF|nr:type II toxin-antitoxin system prevent-host-death family antitoxin [Companilactobacillus farciminis]